jgi:hypothetical protein
MSKWIGLGFINAVVALFVSATIGSAQFRATPQPDTKRVAHSLWEHNGSTMYLVASGTKREFYYQAPRQEMLQAGAAAGSLSFNGIAKGGQYVGTAYIFNPRCGAFPYQVSGPILNDYRRVVQRAAAAIAIKMIFLT